HHVYRYVADVDEDPRLNGMKFEVQFRSRLEHLWATTVEFVGTFQGTDLKSGEGDPDWLRFFSLAGDVIARRDGKPVSKRVPAGPVSFEREFRTFCDRLRVFNRMSNYTTYMSRNPAGPWIDSKYFVMTGDLRKWQIDCRGFGEHEFAA